MLNDNIELIEYMYKSHLEFRDKVQQIITEAQQEAEAKKKEEEQ